MPHKKNQRSRVKRTWLDSFLYCGFNNFFRLIWMIYLGLRAFRSDRFPEFGPGLICSNHQSHLDPILVGNSCQRYVTFVARESLFKFKPFGWLIARLGAFPINRDAGLGGIKTTLRKLKSGELVLIFPEGTRTPDGELKPFKPGFCAIARRARVPIIPVAIDGAYQAWPKSAPAPRPGNVRVKIGEPISIDQVADLPDDELTALVQSKVAALLEEIRSGDLT